MPQCGTFNKLILQQGICGEKVDSKEFLCFRKQLNKTQKQMAQLLGTSLKAIHSYDQGWRTIPAHVERQIFFLATRLRENRKKQKP